MSTPTPDYGEPWRQFDFDIYNTYNEFVAHSASPIWPRIIACVNALAGIQNPAVHLANLNAAIEQQAETLKVMNDALKEAHRVFGNLSHSQVVQRLCPDFAEVAELVRKSHDQHA